MDIKEFFGTDWRSMMSDAALAEAERYNQMIPILRAEHGSEKWDEEGPFDGELKWNLWAKAFKDDFLIDIEESEEDIFGNGKQIIHGLEDEENSRVIDFTEGLDLIESGNYLMSNFDFSRFIFPGPVSFEHVSFLQGADFTAVTFFSEVDFCNSIFSKSADFRVINFYGGAYFSEATFLGCVEFGFVKFYNNAIFDKAVFSADVEFCHVLFNNKAVFRSSISHCDLSLKTISFLGIADFSYAQIKGMMNIQNTNFGGLSYFFELEEVDTDMLDKIEELLITSDVNSIPNFIGLQIPVALDLGYIDIKYHKDMLDPDASAKFRKLKEMAAQTSNHSKELEFFREELIHKKHTIKSDDSKFDWTGPLIGFYETFARCGTSAARPALWLFSIMFLFSFLYFPLSPNWQSGSFEWLTFMKFSFHQAVPFLSLGGGEAEAVVKLLYGGYDTIPDGVGLLSGFHRAISLTLEFLIGLGIRNYYRM